MKKIYSEPEMMLSLFSSEDIVTTSGYTSNSTVEDDTPTGTTNSIRWDAFGIAWVG